VIMDDQGNVLAVLDIGPAAASVTERA
jgi:hypothetical protein